MKKTFKLFFLIVLALAFTACNTDNDTQISIQSDYFTVTRVNNRFVLYADAGHIVKFTSEADQSVAEAFPNGVERLSLTYSCDLLKLTKEGDVEVVNDAEPIEATKVPVLSVMDVEDAKAAKVTEKDSIFNIVSIQSMWATRGYLTITLNGSYSVVGSKNILPTMNLVLDETEISEDNIKFHLYYNRHSSKDVSSGGVYQFITSYPLTPFKYMIPGNNDVIITVAVEGPDGKTQVSKPYKVSRKNLSFYTSE